MQSRQAAASLKLFCICYAITMDEWDTQQAQLDDADEEGAVLALAEGCAAFRAGVAADDDDVELVGVQTPAERAAESRRRAEAEGKVLEIDDDVEFLGTRQAEQRPVRRHLAEPPRRKSPPPARHDPDLRRQHREADRRPVRLRVVRRDREVRVLPGLQRLGAAGAHY